jgi:predicted helicase
MARCARSIRATVLASLDAGTASAAVRALADAFAQVVVYAAFAARMEHGNTESFSAGAALRAMRGHPSVRALDAFVNGPESVREPFAAAVAELCRVLDAGDVDAALAQVRRSGASGDPLLDFYETFLAAYDPRLRAARGVYFTPLPIVRYVVRSVAEVCEDAFGVALGASDRFDVLDPACGTGTFLNELVVVLRERFIERGDPAGWRLFVRTVLLARLAGCELLAAPHAAAHLTVERTLRGADLAEPDRSRYGYALRAGDRLRIRLANALATADAEPGAARGGAARDEIAIVLGNPPYSGHSANAGAIGPLMRAYAANAGEANVKWLHDDYVKFVRFAEDRVARAGRGVVAFVTNHAYIDNPTFAGMRRHLMRTFDEISVLDLHGNAKIGETAPGRARDENVFDIRLGVAIGIFVKRGTARAGACAVRFAELYGERQDKYDRLTSATVRSTPWRTVVPDAGFASFRPARTSVPLGYAQAPSLASVMPLSSLGVLTKRDALAVAFTKREVLERLASFADPVRTDDETAAAFGLPLRDNDRWSVAAARRVAASARPAHVRAIQYRCGDVRCYYDAPGIVARRNRRVLDHVAGAERFALLAGRQGGAATSGPWDSVWVTAMSSDQNLFRRGGATVFPVVLNGSGDCAQQPRWNLSNEFVDYVAARARESDGAVVQRRAVGYIYGLLNAPRYRAEFASELKREFPRIPVVDAETFAALSAIGWRLLRLHLLTDAAPGVTFPLAGDDVVGSVRFMLADIDDAGYGSVVVNPAGQRFERVHRHAWQRTCGGAPVLENYLRARKGRRLESAEIGDFARLATAFDRERGLLAEADEILSALLDAAAAVKV